MRAYLDLLRIPDYRKLWAGATLSLLGDGATWTALAWLCVLTGGARALGTLGICYFAPILVGGLLASRVVDRFSRRNILVADSVVRATAVAAVPVLHLAGVLRVWQLYLVAGVYGLLKILPLGVIPAVLPELVPKERLQTAIAMESVSYGAAGLVGPALGGLLIPLVGGPWVLALDAASYLAFAGSVLWMTNRLGRPAPSADEVRDPRADARRSSLRPALRFVLGDRVMLVITIAFTAFNAAMGMLIVAQPWLAHFRLPGGAAMLGALVAVLAGAELAGSLIAGLLRPAVRPMFRIGVLQLLCGVALLLLLGAQPALIMIGQICCGVPAMIKTVSSQSVRYERTPELIRARTTTLMRTLMHGAVPVGSLVGGMLLGGGHYDALVLVMAVVAGAPGLLIIGLTRHSVVLPEPVKPPGPGAATGVSAGSPNHAAEPATSSAGEAR